LLLFLLLILFPNVAILARFPWWKCHCTFWLYWQNVSFLLFIAFHLWKDVAHLYRVVILASPMFPFFLLMHFPYERKSNIFIGLSYWPILHVLPYFLLMHFPYERKSHIFIELLFWPFFYFLFLSFS
jgi:hypothetical protein